MKEERTEIWFSKCCNDGATIWPTDAFDYECKSMWLVYYNDVNRVWLNGLLHRHFTFMKMISHGKSFVLAALPFGFTDEKMLQM